MKLTLLSKPGCHLCEAVREVLDELQTEYRFAFEEIDITSDPGLFAQYRYEIPVLLMEGKEIARGRITDRELLRILQ